MKARPDGDHSLLQLLERSSVSVNGTSFRIEAGFPLALIAEQLENCASERDGGAR
ncbi:MAG TPA: hypothetical protein VGL13_18260 [Polyangiaceae bacterium]